ncbi:putative gustatory receptor 98b [Lucilia cuprina]|uniref:putative gustatory receptor 98b n=1 Tax=Lucilia cuprina TaxID=7375 RepID=UPI001F05D223|nr:putative gustatory receptor 98b [Lucilia cuprina]
MDGNLEDSILLKELKVYQWIFSIFGLNLPPFLIYRSQKDFKYYFVLLIYIVYCLILISTAMWAAHSHNDIVKKGTLRYNLDFMTALVSYIQNVAMAGLQLLFEFKCCCCYHKFCEILLSIRKLERNIFTMCPVILKKQPLRRCLMMTTAPGLFILVSFLIYFNVMLIGIDLELKYKFLAAMFLMTIQIKFLEYGIYVQLIYEYLSMLLESLRCLKENVNNSAERKQSLDWSFCKYFKQNQACLQETWFLVYRLEQYFAWPVLLLFLYNGIIILCTVSWGYVRYTYETEFVYQISNLSYYN